MRFWLLPALLFALFTAGCAPEPVTPADQAAFLTTSDFVSFGYPNPKLPAGQFEKISYGKGTFDMSYEADTPANDTNESLYLHETLSQEETVAEAIAYLVATRASLLFEMRKSNKVTESPVPNQTIYGDGSSLTMLQSDQITVGNVFTARHKGRTFTLMMVGTPFTDAKHWDDFAGQKINAWLNAAT